MNAKIIFYFLFILTASLVLAGCSDKPAKYDSFAQCLTEKDTVMYGTDWCLHCKNQKKLFGNSFKYVDYVNCDINRDECLRNGVNGYPTWKINETNHQGEQSLYRLASITGCKLD